MEDWPEGRGLAGRLGFDRNFKLQESMVTCLRAVRIVAECRRWKLEMGIGWGDPPVRIRTISAKLKQNSLLDQRSAAQSYFKNSQDEKSKRYAVSAASTKRPSFQDQCALCICCNVSGGFLVIHSAEIHKN